MIMETFTQVLGQYFGLLSLTIVFPIYTLYILWRNKWQVPHSISDSYYILKEKERHEEILFTLFTFFLGIGTILHYPSSFLFFLSGMGFFWVGTQTQFKGISIKRDIHYIGAILGIVCSLVGLLINGIWLPLPLWLGGSLLLSTQLDYKGGTLIFWAEILAFIVIIGGLWAL